MASLSVVAPLGPNPAALTELLWQLHHDGEGVGRLSVVLESERAEHWWRVEGEAAYEELLGCCPGLPLRADLDLVLVDAPEDQAAAFGEAFFQALRRAQRGQDPVLVALSGGRWRGCTALTSTAFQLLARRQDRLVDVRVDTPAAEGGSGFFFPDQARQQLTGTVQGQARPFLARDVRVLLEPVPVARLRAFLDRSDLVAFSRALDASDRALRAAEPPRITLDLLKGSLVVAGRPVALPPTCYPLFAWVAVMTRAGKIARSADVEGFRAFLQEWEAAAPSAHNMLWQRHKNSVASQVLDERIRRAEDIASPFSRARAAIRRHLAEAGVPRRDLVEVSHRTEHDGEAKFTRLLLELPRERIELVGSYQPSVLGPGEAAR